VKLDSLRDSKRETRLILRNLLNTKRITHAFRALEQNRLAVAEAGFNSALDRAKNDYRAYVGLAKLDEQRGHFDKALSNWNKSISLQPSWFQNPLGDFDPSSGKISCLLAMYRSTEARQLSLQKIQQNPSDIGTHILLARSYMREARYEEAIEQWTQVRDLFPDSKDAVIGQANCLIDASEFPRAHGVLALSATRWPDNAELRLAQARLALSEANFCQAKNILMNLKQVHSVTSQEML
jgi:Tfp pilus assembly protein PilF